MNLWNLKRVSIVGLVILLSAVVVAGQSVRRINVDVPFEFRVGDSTMPAGEYRVEYPTVLGGDLVLLSDANGKGLLLLRSRMGDMEPKVDEPYLLFNVYGKVHFLARISRGAMEATLDLPMSRAERETIKEAKKLAESRAKTVRVTGS